jgi:hypothetical protein
MLFETSIFCDDTHNTSYQAAKTWMLPCYSKALTVDWQIANDGDGGHGTSNAVCHLT